MIDGFKPPKRTSGPQKIAKIAREDMDQEPSFKPPEEVAKTDSPLDDPAYQTPAFANKPPTKQRRLAPIAWFKGLRRRNKILLLASIVLVIGGVSAAAYTMLRSKPAPPAPVVVEQKKEEPPKATPIFSPLTGIAVSKEQSELPVTGIMIENSPDSRPQAGLNQAGVVFEAISEGGITRFLSLFQETQPDYVGPVRSVRPYYLDWLQGFDAAIAHVGGSAEALAKIRSEGIKDLDQFYNTGPYRRVNNRYAPHNVYTSLSSLVDLQKAKGWAKSTFTGFPRKPEKPSAAPTARTIDVVISGALYNVHYDYDVATNSYKRVLASKPHLDERSKEQLSPKVVIVLVTPYGIHPDRIHSVYQTIGSGKTFIFQDGVAVEGTWEKTSSKAQITFKDAAGTVIALNAGQTWVTATSIANNVTYKP